MNEKRMEIFCEEFSKQNRLRILNLRLRILNPLQIKVKGEGLRILNLGLRILNPINFHFSSALGCTGFQLK